MDGIHTMLDENRTLKARALALEAKLKILDELADEILLLQNPEAMREVALYIKTVVKE